MKVMTRDPRLIRLLRAAFDQLQESPTPALHEERKWEFVFHMTDWAQDLQKLAELYRHPEAFDKAAAQHAVAGFLYHAIPHLKAAGRLLLDEIPDAFEGRTAADIQAPIARKKKRRVKANGRKPQAKVA
jgi:hypothetical protein